MSAQELRKSRIPTARDWMQPPRLTLTPEMDLVDGIHALIKFQATAAPVVDPDGRLVGMLTEKDCLRIVSNAAFDNPHGGTVAHYMSPPRRRLASDMDLFGVADCFLATNFPMLPVVEDDKLVGLISRQQMLGKILAFTERLSHERQQFEANAGAPTDQPQSIDQLQRRLADYRRQ